MLHLQRVLLVSVAACVWLAGAERKPFSLGAPERIAELPADPGRVISVGYLEDGSRWAITAEDVTQKNPRLYLSRPGGTQAVPVSLAQTVGALGPECQFMPWLSVDLQGYAWLPAACKRGQELSFALIRAGAGGEVTSVVLNPPVEARSVAVGPDGTLFVLGIEAAFFRGTAPECHLIHQYTSSGERIRSFSPCPAGEAGGFGPTLRNGVNYESLKLEADYGKVWRRHDQVLHLLPQTGELRTFTPDGVLIRTVRFERPEGSAARYVIHALFPLGNGRFLVFWRSNLRDGNTMRASGGAALHGPDGRMLSELAGPEPFAGRFPAFVNARGECIFQSIEAATGRTTLWKADVLQME